MYLLEVLVRHAQADCKAFQQLVNNAFAFAHESQGLVPEAWTAVIHWPVVAPLPLVICHLDTLFVISKACT